MTVADRVRDVVVPLLDERGLDLYDVEHAGPVLRVVVDRAGGLDLDALADATRAVSRALDEADPISGRYTLEVTSPGLERPLRTPRHFARAVGETVKIKVTAAAAGESGERRLSGVLAAADDDGITVRSDAAGDTQGAGASVDRHVSYGDIERARTVFEWGPAEKPGGKRRQTRRSQAHDTSNEKKDHRP